MKLEFPIPLKDVAITLKRGVCYGPCPVYTVTIHGDGSVVFEGEGCVDAIGEHRGQVPPEVVFDLFRRALEMGFFEMRHEYMGGPTYELDAEGNVQEQFRCPTDHPQYEVTIRVGQRSKSVTNYYYEPRRLRSLQKTIGKVAGTERWIGSGGRGEDRDKPAERHPA